MLDGAGDCPRSKAIQDGMPQAETGLGGGRWLCALQWALYGGLWAAPQQAGEAAWGRGQGT